MRDSTALLLASLVTLALTAAHHVYGALRYDTPWRLHAVVVAVVAGAALAAASALYRAHPATPVGRAAAWTLIAIAALVPVLAIGGFEGFYNHVVKDALYLAGAPRDLLLRLFPPPTYELPNDAVFEISGVLQVVPAAFAARAALRTVKELR